MSILTIGIAVALNVRQERPFEMFDTEKSEIVRAFFKRADVGAVWIVDPKVKGKATVSVKSERFEIMLSSLMTQINATYYYKAGTFHVIPVTKKEPTFQPRI